MARKPATVPASAAAGPRPAHNGRARAAEQASRAANASLVVMSLMVLSSLLFLVGPALETLFRGAEEDMFLFDTAIRLSSMSVSSKIAIAFGYLIVALLTLLISGKINGKMWTFVFGVSLASLICCVYGFAVVSDARFSDDQLAQFTYSGNVLGKLTDELLETDPANYQQDYGEAKEGFVSSIKSWFMWGGIWNLFVIVSMIKNKVDSDFLKRVIGVGI